MPNLDKDFYLDKQGLRQLVNELETNIVASEYDTSVSYSVGQYCIYENNFYRCTTATTGTWDSTAWVKVIISDEIPSIKSITTAQWEALTPAQKASGDYVITDAPTVPLTAENVPYDDTVSGLTADNVQDAIDELSQSSGASSVAQLEDVQLNNLSDNDLLVYDSNLTGGKLWKNAKKIVTCTKAQFDTWSANNSFPYTDCKYIVTDVNNLNTTSADIPYDSTGTNSVKDKIDSLEIHRAYSYRLQSTVSFQDALSDTSLGANAGIGQFLDEKVHAVRTSFSTTNINYYHDSVGGALMFAIVFAYGASYYCGYATTYHSDNIIYGGYGLLQFQFMNGTFTINYTSSLPITS